MSANEKPIQSDLAVDTTSNSCSLDVDNVVEQLKVFLEAALATTATSLNDSVGQHVEWMAQELQSSQHELLQQIKQLQAAQDDTRDPDDVDRQDVSHSANSLSIAATDCKTDAIEESSTRNSNLSGLDDDLKDTSMGKRCLDSMHTKELIPHPSNKIQMSSQSSDAKDCNDAGDEDLFKLAEKNGAKKKHNLKRISPFASSSKDQMPPVSMQSKGRSLCILPGAIDSDVEGEVIPDMAPRSESCKSLASVRAETDMSILRSHSLSPEGDDSLHCHKQKCISARTMYPLSFMRRIWVFVGIVPSSTGRCSEWYRWLVMLLVASVTSYPAIQLVQEEGQVCENLARLALTLCAGTSLVCLRSLRKVLGPDEFFLVSHAASHGFLHDWGTGGLRSLFALCIVWLVTTGTSFSSEFHVRQAGSSWMNVLVDSLCTLILFVVAHCELQMMAFLELLVDAFCVEILEDPCFRRGVTSWNTLQSLLRFVATTLEKSLLVAQTTAMVGMFFCFAHMIHITIQLSSEQGSQMGRFGIELVSYLPFLSFVVVSCILFAKAAAITEKCMRVAPLVNSMKMENNQTDHMRSYLVSFIMNSDAGFHVKGIRLTASMLMKFCYMFGAVVCGLGTTVVSILQNP